MNKKIRQALMLGLAGFLLGFIPWSQGWLRNLEGDSWDWRVATLAEPSEASPEI